MLAIEKYQNLVGRIDETIHAVFHIHGAAYTTNKLVDVGKYALSTTGKMLRGIMLLEACRAVDGDPEQVLHAAAGTEYGHLASLVHDDLIDLDELRRGRRTIWREYGSDAAILAGDLFIFEAFHCLSLCRHHVDADRIVRTLEVLSKGCIDLCLGQALEEKLIKNCSARSEDYIEMVRLKTGSLFRAALESGAILGGGNESQIEAIREYGEHLGIAFQIIDDLLPYMSDEKITGKKKMSDIKNHRVTLPIIYAIENSKGDDRHILCEIFEKELLDDEEQIAYDAVNAILERTQAKIIAEEEALNHKKQAMDCLSLLPQNEGREHLEYISLMAVRRQQ